MDDFSQMRSGRPSKAYRESLRPPTKHDMRKLEIACVQAIINDQKYVVLVCSYITRFPSDFPRATIELSNGLVDHRRVNARQCLQWLNDKGYSSITLEDLRVMKMKFTKGEYGVEAI